MRIDNLKHFHWAAPGAAYLQDQYALLDSYLPRKDAQRFLEGEVDAFRKRLGKK